jgi:energy-coupling factor transporter ATP-binding protein EcfA2
MAAFMIAVTGGSGSGKTTLARALHARLGPDRCQLVTEDNYYFARAHYGEAALGMSHAELERTFDFDDPANKDMAHLRRDIEALKRGEAVEQPVYDFPTHDRTSPSSISSISPSSSTPLPTCVSSVASAATRPSAAAAPRASSSNISASSAPRRRASLIPRGTTAISWSPAKPPRRIATHPLTKTRSTGSSPRSGSSFRSSA